MPLANFRLASPKRYSDSINCKVDEQMTKEQHNTPTNIASTFNEILDLFENQGIVVFCGAGISFNSGLPLARELMRVVMSKVQFEDGFANTLLESNLPFESFFETLWQNSNLDPILNIFDIGQPSLTHVLFAKLAKSGYLKTICTTNFDRLIERAMQDERLREGHDYRQYYRDQDIGSIDFREDMIKVIKIHGSIDDKNNMNVNLYRVAQNIISQSIRRLINNIFLEGEHESVLVLGYSCSDVFDISPLVSALKNSPKRIYFIEHCKSGFTVENLQIKKEKNPFQHFQNGILVKYDTDRLIKLFWDHFYPESPMPINISTDASQKWREYVDKWYAKTKPGTGLFICGHLLTKLNDHTGALDYSKKALEFVEESGDKELEGRILGNIGQALLELNQYNESIEFSERAMVIAKQEKDKRTETTSLLNIGSANVRLGNPQIAISFLDRALSIAIAEDDYWKAVICGFNLGKAYGHLGQYSKALEFFDQGLRNASALGLKKEEGAMLSGIGGTLDAMGNYKEAIKNFEEALKVSRYLGDKKSEANDLSSLGSSFLSLGDYPRAIDLNLCAIEIAKEISDLSQEACSLSHIGNAYYLMGEYEKAKEFHMIALGISRKIEDKNGTGKHLCNLANAYRRLGEMEKAIELYVEAVAAAHEIGDIHSEGIRLSGLAATYLSLKQYSDALEYFHNALEIAELIGDRNGEASRLANIGSCYYGMGNLELSLESYNKALNIFVDILGENHPNVQMVKNGISMILGK
jgi:tetratricopeptide (TPR) repeat protein